MSKWQGFIIIVLIPPVRAQEVPVCRPNWALSESAFRSIFANRVPQLNALARRMASSTKVYAMIIVSMSMPSLMLRPGGADR